MAEKSEVIDNFLAGLPSKQTENFTRWDGRKTAVAKRPQLDTKDVGVKQVIVNEKDNILLRLMKNYEAEKRTASGHFLDGFDLVSKIPRAPADESEVPEKRRRNE